jgi:murein DD-endopeptidase MepM/ murein hydrolase activator NlpD
MTLRLVNARLLLMGLAVTVVMLAGCGGSSANRTGSHQALENSTLEAPTPSPEPPTATPPPTSTPLPPGLEVKPVEVPQGGAAIVFLNEPAASATVTFGGRQYPMLHDGVRWWAMIGLGALAMPGPASVTATYTPAGRGSGQSSVTKSITIVDREFPIEYIQLAPSTAALLAPATVQEELNRRAAVYSGYTTERLWHGPFQRPARGEITGIYGEGRSYNGAPATDYHRGTDFTGETGDPVFAAAAGRVVFTGELKVRGNAIMVDHGAGLFTAYHHLSAFYVAEGDFVTPGQQIGAIGSTGLATGSHLHWEVVVRGVEVDGQLWLDGSGMGP